MWLTYLRILSLNAPGDEKDHNNLPDTVCFFKVLHSPGWAFNHKDLFLPFLINLNNFFDYVSFISSRSLIHLHLSRLQFSLVVSCLMYPTFLQVQMQHVTLTMDALHENAKQWIWQWQVQNRGYKRVWGNW